VQVYLPIADLPVNIFLMLGMGLAVGFISGMFGIGGGFLMTPLLIFVGITPAVAVASVTTHVAASSMSGAISYWRRRTVDLALALMLLAGGILGTAVGVWLFTVLRSLDQLDLTIGLSYVALLTIVGGLMITESVRCALGTVGLRNAPTPLLTASTPVMAVQPFEKTCSNSQTLATATAGSAAFGGGTTGTG